MTAAELTTTDSESITKEEVISKEEAKKQAKKEKKEKKEKKKRLKNICKIPDEELTEEELKLKRKKEKKKQVYAFVFALSNPVKFVTDKKARKGAVIVAKDKNVQMVAKKVAAKGIDGLTMGAPVGTVAVSVISNADQIYEAVKEGDLQKGIAVGITIAGDIAEDQGITGASDAAKVANLLILAKAAYDKGMKSAEADELTDEFIAALVEKVCEEVGLDEQASEMFLKAIEFSRNKLEKHREKKKAKKALKNAEENAEEKK